MQNIVLIFFLSCIIFSFCGGNLGNPKQVWQFGKDRGGDYVVDRYSGDIHSHKRIKHIPLNVKPCNEVDFVRVEIMNSYPKPNVRFDNKRQTITVSYRQGQNRPSPYMVLAKSRRTDDCKDLPPPPSETETDEFSSLPDTVGRLALDYYGY